MKKIILSLICLITIADLHCQVKEIKIKNNDLKITEKVTVLKSDKNIRQGSYEKYIDIPQLNQKTLIEKGQYDNNEKIGIWNYYDENGKITLQYNFDNDSVSIYDGLNVDGLKKIRPLIYLGSRDEIIHISRCGVKLPVEAYKLGQSGRIIVEFQVNEFGEVSDYTIKKGINKPLDSEAMRVAKLIPVSWLPALKNGVRTKFTYNLPITFVIF